MGKLNWYSPARTGSTTADPVCPDQVMSAHPRTTPLPCGLQKRLVAAERTEWLAMMHEQITLQRPYAVRAASTCVYSPYQQSMCVLIVSIQVLLVRDVQRALLPAHRPPGSSHVLYSCSPSATGSPLRPYAPHVTPRMHPCTHGETLRPEP